MEAKKLINLAEESFKHGNLDAAVKLAVKAMYCDPEVSNDTIAHLSAYMIHKAMSLEQRTWYKVLGVQQTGSDQATIKKQYKKMALLVHPDKNKSVAAESAFKFVKQAWDVLSDPEKKKDYDFNLQ
jgi:DnaJ-domain-containing protein 1